jgi:hypothetical protein
MKALFYINLACLGINTAAYVVNPTWYGALFVLLPAGAAYVLREAGA